MEVILKEDLPKLGNRGDVIKVADGYGRNYLLPNKLAIEASAGNKAVIEQMKLAAARKISREKGAAELLAKHFEGVSLLFTRKAGEGDQLFGSVTSSDIAHELEGLGFNIDRRKIMLDHPLKTVGEYNVGIHLHRDVKATVKVTVAKQAEAEGEAPAAPAAKA